MMYRLLLLLALTTAAVVSSQANSTRGIAKPIELWAIIKQLLNYGSDTTPRTDESEDPGTDATFCDNVPVMCENTKYRSFDGSCNNLEHSWWGTPDTPYKRLKKVELPYGVEPIYNKTLPNARLLSRLLYIDKDIPDNIWTLVFMQFGQLLTHDMVHTKDVPSASPIKCCTDDGKMLPNGTTNIRCVPISISKSDPVYAAEGRTCMNFIRVKTTKDLSSNCTNATENAEPITAVTSYVDASFLYGSNNETVHMMRKFVNGFLAFDKLVHGNGQFPIENPDRTTCNVVSNNEPCFFLGDNRANQNPQLTLLHIIFLRFHNYLAQGLAKVNPHWNDETLFQEARRMLIAVLQKIAYYDYIRGLLGDKIVREHKICNLDAKGPYDDYDPKASPGITNEFAACGFRFSHSQIQGLLRLVEQNRNTSSTIYLSDWFNNPSVLVRGDNYNYLMTGLVTQPMSKQDRYVTKAIHEELFHSNKSRLGIDLKATDYQRARDQRVMSCVEARRYFNLSVPKCFEDYKAFMPSNIVDILKRLYRSYKDVELCVCTDFENHPNSLFGELGAALVKEQFLRTRRADRYFFENKTGNNAFNQKQWEEIHKSTLSQIFCTDKNMKQIQVDAFRLISDKNPLVPCSSIPKFNFEPFKDTGND